jgi:hypothetical protein
MILCLKNTLILKFSSILDANWIKMLLRIALMRIPIPQICLMGVQNKFSAKVIIVFQLLLYGIGDLYDSHQ